MNLYKVLGGRVSQAPVAAASPLAGSSSRLVVMVLRQLLSIAILPFTVTVLVPRWIARANRVRLTVPDAPAALALLGLGLLALALGLVLFGWSLFLFWTRGRGTLAPWDPPRVFVADGPYRYVRNPMISGVLFILLAESLILRSWPHAQWTGIFLVLNLIYLPLVEEPMLAARFGDSYRDYKRNVRRFLPRLRPWHAPRDRDRAGDRP